MVEAIRQGDIPGVQLRVRQPLAVGLDEAWRWLTEPERIARWVCDEARVEGAPPAEVKWLTTGAGGIGGRGTTVRCEPPLVWSLAYQRDDWPAVTRLTFELGRPSSGVAGGCEISVLHQNFERLPLSRGLTIWEDYRRRWRTAVERLARAVG